MSLSSFFYRCCCAAVLLVVVAQALASEPLALHKVVLEVPSEARADRQRALRRGLKMVFVRVSGDSDVVRHYPSLSTHLTNASRYLSSYEYQRQSLPVSQAAGERGPQRLLIELVFQRDSVQKMLERAGAPSWQARRPDVLLWLAAERGGAKFLVNADVDAEMASGMGRAAQGRGLALIEPLLDLEEQQRLTVRDVWGFDQQAIGTASAHYGAKAVLVGRLSETSRHRWLGRWQFIYRGEVRDVPVDVGSLDTFLAAGIDLAADTLAQRYAVASVAGGAAEQWLLRVEGVDSPQAYARLAAHLGEQGALADLVLQQVERDTVLYRFAATAPAKQLRAVLEFDKRMVFTEEYGGQLHYRWSDSRR